MNGSHYRYGRKKRYYAKERKQRTRMSFEKRTMVQLLAAVLLFALCFALSHSNLPYLQSAKIYVARALISTTDIQETRTRFLDFYQGLREKYPALDQYLPAQTQPESAQAPEEQPEAVPASGEEQADQSGEPMVANDAQAALGLVAQAAPEPEAVQPAEYVFPDTVDITLPIYGEITSPYGGREHPLTQGESNHQGVDIAANHGDPIVAAAPGKVVTVGYNDVDGNHVVIQHTARAKTVYAHMDQIAVKEGDIVTRETQLGTVGDTGLATGPHLHFEILENDQSIDPERYISLPHRP